MAGRARCTDSLGFLALASAAIFIVASHAVSDKKCGDTIHLDGCGPGAYNCCPDGSYSCRYGGTSASKMGAIFPYRICETQAEMVCDEGDQLCQRDTYYTGTNCGGLWCNEYSRYITGCQKGGAVP
jgi:hypothetical protein